MSTKNDLFDIIKLLYTDSNEFNKLADIALSRNSFMINRFIGIKHPLQAQAFNMSKTNMIDVIKFWNSYLGNQKYVPSYIYTKGANKSNENKLKNRNAISNEELHTFCMHNNVNAKDVKVALELFNEDMINEIKDFIKTIKE